MLVDEMKARVMAALKSGDTVTKEVLRVALGEIQTAEARGTVMNDEAAMAVVKKLVKSNEETLAVARDDAQRDELTREITVLRSLLPTSMGVDAIVTALAPVTDALRAAGNDGQATGLAMKHLKGITAVVDGKDVAAAVRKVRG